MAERPLRSEDERLLSQLRAAYEQLEPSDALLGRVQARLGTALEGPPRRVAKPEIRRAPRVRSWLAIAALSATAWGLWHALRSPKAPAPPAPVDAALLQPRPAPPASVATPQRAEASDSALAPAPPPAPADPFFDLPGAARGGHAAKGLNPCIGTWDDAAVFPRLGFSARPALEAWLGAHSCTLHWSDAQRGDVESATGESDPGTSSARGPRARDIALLFRRGDTPLLACETDRGIRIPLSIEIDGLVAAVSGSATLLMRSEDQYALSFRWRQWSPRGGERAGTEGKPQIFSILISATGPILELRRHGSWTASIAAREHLEGRGSRRRTGELRCLRAR